MKWLVIGAIQLYWLIAPRSLRDRCLFKESCSHHVMAAARDGGMRGAYRAFRTRWSLCRPGWRILSRHTHGEAPLVLSANGSVLPVEILSDRVRRAFGI